MKALILKEYNKLIYDDIPNPEIGPDDVLIQVKACGICGSDVHGIDGSTGRRIPPVVMGHEASGVIAEAGKNVQDFVPGDRVTFDSTIYCGDCFFCRSGNINLCDNRRVLGVSCDEYRHHGAYADYVAVPSHILYRLPEGLGFEQATLVEPLSVALHAVRLSSVSFNDTAVVVGSGMIGLLTLQVLRATGCRNVVAVDIDSNKLKLAEKLGADMCLNPEKRDVAAEIHAITENRGADVSFEVVGITPALNTAVDALRKGGTMTLVGNFSTTVELPLQKIVTREITVHGSCASNGEYPDCLDLIARGVVDVDILISSVAPLADGASWFRRLYEREPGLMKVVLVPEC